MYNIGLERSMQRFSPCCLKIFYSRPSEYRLVKGILGFFYGIFLGVAFYILILIDLDFQPVQLLILGVSICLMLGVGNALSIQIRCISLLAIPSFCGRSGRGVLKAVVLAYLIAGPFHNLTINCREVVRVFACASVLTFNMTRTRFELMVRPFQEGLMQMKADMGEVKETLHSIADVVQPIAEEVEDESEIQMIKEENEYIDALQGDTKRWDELKAKYQPHLKDTEDKKYEKGYKKKLEMRCEEIMDKAASNCRKAFSKSYDRCYEKVSWVAAWLLCWPMKLTFVCNIIDAIGGRKTCTAAGDLEPGFGEGYSYLKKAGSAFSKNFQKAKMQYELKIAPPELDIREAADTAEAIAHDFQAKKTLVDMFLMVIKRALSFIFIKIILEAQEYHDKFLTDIEFDNMYLTPYFRKIDARRRKREELTLLPLKKLERLEIVDPYSLCPAPKERIHLGAQTVRLLLEMVTPAAFIMLDILLYETLDLVRRHARIEYTQTGAHDLFLEVKGTGMIAALVRSVLRGFNVKKRVKVVRSNEACLPQPHPIQKYYYYKIFGTYLLVWLLIFGHSYTQRLRRSICAYFYAKREKKRVLFLYNETLKKRVGSARFLKNRVLRKARENRLFMDTTTLMVMRLRFPRLFSWLRIFRVARRKCLICEDSEPLRKSDQLKYFHECETPTCHFIYCNLCWWEIDKVIEMFHYYI
ncbi:protein sneaky [Anabrus simplex]|uniref:protein sneaky n=1 Tax=Anabrus simplex TaxID=316456 RepID=UPI0035A2E2E0